MERKEAIEILEDLDGYFSDNQGRDYDEAFRMAREALSAEAVQIHNDGTLEVKVPNAQKVGRVLVMDTDSHIGGGLFYPDDAVQGWIPCSERLPKAENMYQPPKQRYLCQLEAYGERKFCVLSRLKGSVSPFWDWYGVAVHDSDVTAWMPLPKPYTKGDNDEER